MNFCEFSKGVTPTNPNVKIHRGTIIYIYIIKMSQKINLFRFGGGGPNQPNMAKQLLMIFGVWAAAKFWITRPRSGGGNAQSQRPAPPQQKYIPSRVFYH